MFTPESFILCKKGIHCERTEVLEGAFSYIIFKRAFLIYIQNTPKYVEMLYIDILK